MLYDNQTRVQDTSLAPPAASLLENINKEFGVAGEEFAGLAQRLHRLADRLIGTRPEGVIKASPPENAPQSAMSTLARNSEKLAAVGGYLGEAVERLEAL